MKALLIDGVPASEIGLSLWRSGAVQARPVDPRSQKTREHHAKRRARKLARIQVEEFELLYGKD